MDEQDEEATADDGALAFLLPFARAGTTAHDLRGPGRRLRGAVVRKLGVAILSGEFAPGDTLWTEVASSDALKVSRSAYREALQALAAKGLVESRPKAGTWVLPRGRWHLLDPDVLAWAFIAGPDRNFVQHLFELRAIVEPAAAALAAERRDRLEVKMLKAALSEMTRHTLASDQGRGADKTFHNIILEATRNHALMSLNASIGAAVNYTTKFKQRSRALPRDPIPDHRRVLDAIAARDPDGARNAMRTLVNMAHQDMQDSMDAES